MNKIELSSNRLYVVRPSVVVFDDTEYSFRKTLDEAIIVLPSWKLSSYQIRCIKANLRELSKQVRVFEEKAQLTELDALELENARLAILNLEKIDLQRNTISDHIKNFKWRIASARVKRQQEDNVNEVTHIAKFETKTEDVSIALEEQHGILKPFTSDQVIYDGFGQHCIEGDLHVGVVPNDKILLARYLWEQNVQNTKYTNEVERYILSLKPFYSMKEITLILEQLKSEESIINEKPRTFTLERKRKEPIFIRGTYTDSW